MQGRFLFLAFVLCGVGATGVHAEWTDDFESYPSSWDALPDPWLGAKSTYAYKGIGHAGSQGVGGPNGWTYGEAFRKAGNGNTLTARLCLRGEPDWRGARVWLSGQADRDSDLAEVSLRDDTAAGVVLLTFAVRDVDDGVVKQNRFAVETDLALDRWYDVRMRVAGETVTAHYRPSGQKHWKLLHTLGAPTDFEPHFVGIGASRGGSVDDVGLTTEKAVPSKGTSRDGKKVAGKVLRWGHEMPDAVFVSENVETMEETGVDGIVLDFTRTRKGADGKSTQESLRNHWMSGTRVKIKDIQHNIDALKNTRFQRFTDNFLCIYGNAGPSSSEILFKLDKTKYPDSTWKHWPGDPDASLRAFKDNMVLAAEVCKQTGLKGFFIDIEKYGSWTQMRIDWPQEAFGEDPQTLVDRARKNVAEVFGEVCRAYPDITIIFIQGTYSSHKEKPTLERAFVDGMLLGMKDFPEARLFDGQEQAYDHSIYEQFVRTREGSTATGLAYSDVAALFKERMKFGYGVWLDHRGHPLGGFYADPYQNHFTPGEFENALHYALVASSGGYIWIYGEDSTMWPAGAGKGETPNVSEAYYDAIRNCKTARPLDLSRALRGADKEKLPPSAETVKTKGDAFETAAPELELVAELADEWTIFFDELDAAIWSGNEAIQGKETTDQGEPIAWQPIEVGEYWERQGHRYNGTAVYRRRVTIPAEYEGREVYLILGGLANKCHLHVNGGWVAGHWHRAAGKEPVILNMGKKIKFGEENLITIYVMNWRGPGGLFKPVWLAAGKTLSKEE